MELTERTFRGLARSSPWRWQSVHLVRHAHGGAPEEAVIGARVEAWIRRPGLMRVVADGRTEVFRERARAAARYSTRTWGRGGRRRTLARPGTVIPAVDADGLVTVRPPDTVVDLDDPMWQSYAWIAMLDPAELADGDPDRDPALPAGAEPPPLDPDPYPWAGWPSYAAPVGVEVSDLRETERAGRRTWWARAVPTSAYQPRCSCCPLLPSEVADRIEAEDGGPPLDPGVSYPASFEVALDVGTGICVAVHPQLPSTRSLDAEDSGFDVEIRAVDLDLPKGFFR
ncbi:hypothetical protein GCM10027055_24210 [Janibacter alkaliphilus]|uniref:Uncharacterized protein n=1 Tax=Janibacter alkaliphilus TaxID=1069963 RepID=A0A852XC18_9MICO|nr:hypothetical protein [Janibacter alkaliphilus]NYG38273.1 hypothetical protein [Janibacter alkaliphilus]